MVDVAVIGDGIVELAAALEFAELGLSVRIARPLHPQPDGAVAGFDPATVTDADGTLAQWLEKIATPVSAGASPVPAVVPRTRPPEAVRLRSASGEWAPQPTPAVFGIPAVPLSREAQRVLGGAAATRAFLDRVLPLLTIGKTERLGDLVRARLGRSAHQRLVLPFIWERYGVGPDEVDVAVAAPGLNEDVTTAASLCGAALEYSERYVARETSIEPSGGWGALRDSLLERLALYAVQVCRAEVRRVSQVVGEPGGSASDREWTIEEQDASGEVSTVAARAVVIGEQMIELDVEAGTDPLDLDGERRVIVTAQATAPAADLLSDPAHDALELVRDDAGDTWAVRWIPPRDRGEGGREAPWTVRCSGPAKRRSGEGGEREAEAILLALGIGTSSDVSVRVVPAPFATRDARDAMSAHSTSLRETERTCLRVGPTLHSGNLAAAVHDAREASAQLRRRLAGIAE